MRLQKIVVAMMLVVALFVSAQAYAAVEEPDVLPYYSYTHNISAGLSMSGTGVASCYGSIGVYNNSSEIDLNVRLQKKEGSVWVLVKKWSTSCTGRYTISISKDYSVEAGTYRVIASGIVTDANGDFETVSCISNARTYAP